MTIRAQRPARALPTMIAALLAVILALTSVTMAVARGQTRVAGQVVLCSGYGVVVLDLDAAGNPLGGSGEDAGGGPAGTVHLCPDMVLSMLVALPLAGLWVPRPAAWRLASPLREAALLPAGRVPEGVRARGPPAA